MSEIGEYSRQSKSSCGQGWRRLLALIVLGAFCCTAFGQSANEFQVKSAYLYNFAKLAEWPAASLPAANSPMVFCLLGGGDSFEGVLRATVAGKTVGGHSVTVRTAESTEDLGPCHVVFVRAAERARTPAVSEVTAGKGILLIGEDRGFLSDGGMLNMFMEDGKVRFQVNMAALQRAGFRYDASVLAMARDESGAGGVTQSPGARAVRVRVPPDYPSLARQMNLRGVVQLQVVVQPDGAVKDVRILGGHPLLGDAATRAVRQWKFQPAARESAEIVRVSFGD